MSSAKILIVEDNEVIAFALNEQLIDLGYEVSGVASSGRDALRRMSECLPDAVLMDIGLHGEIDGIETARRIPPALEIAVIYLSGSSGEATLNRARETRPYGYIIKPFTARELHATIQMALERRDAAMALTAAEQRLEKTNAALQAEIAARIKSEQEIARERDNAQRYLDVAGVMILKLDTQGVITLINNRGCAILGYDRPAEILA